MATRQYIGARYVPLFFENSSTGDSTWAANTQYEPLTIVTWNGNSYTSKKLVPASVGDPSANPSYWASTGIYNAQIESLREDIQAVSDSLVTKRNNKRKFMLFGDSYGRGTDGDNNTQIVSGGGWAVRFKTLMNNYGIEVIHCTEAGGFNYGNTCLDVFNTYYAAMTEEERAAVTDVIFIGGWNDQWHTEELVAKTIQFVQRVKTVMPQAEVVIAPMTCNPLQGVTLLSYYTEATKSGARVSPDLINVLAKKSFTGADGIHPTAAGYSAIQQFINEFILFGKTNYRWAANATYRNADNESIDLTVIAENGKTTIAPVGSNRGGYLLTKSVVSLNKTFQCVSTDFIQVGIVSRTIANASVYDSAGSFKNVCGWYFTAADTFDMYATFSGAVGDKVCLNSVIQLDMP